MPPTPLLGGWAEGGWCGACWIDDDEDDGDDHDDHDGEDDHDDDDGDDEDEDDDDDAYGRKTVRAFCFFFEYCSLSWGWGGVGWGGMLTFLVLRT